MGTKGDLFIGAWISQTFLERIEAFLKEEGYNNKSEFLRIALRHYMKEQGNFNQRVRVPRYRMRLHA